MNQVVISMTDGTTTNNLVYANNDKTHGYVMKGFLVSNNASVQLEKLLTDTQASPGDNAKYFFTAEKIRDEDGSFSQDEPIMNTGDMVTFFVSVVAPADMSFTKVGSLTTAELKGSDLVIRPRTQ